MSQSDRITLLRDKIAGTRFASSADSIISIVRGQEPLRAGMAVEVTRSSNGRTAPNGAAYHLKIRASTETIARDQGIIPMSAWEKGGLRNFSNNPIILAFHDHKQPIGRSVYTELSGSSMDQYWEFHEETDISRTMKSLYERGFMRAASVGFSVLDWAFIDELDDREMEQLVEKYGASAVRDIFWIARKAELLETSAVPVPSDPNALAFSFAARNAEAQGFDVSSLISIRSNDMETAPVTPATTEAERTAPLTVDALKDIVEKGFATLSASIAELGAAIRSSAPQAENTPAEGTSAPVESATTSDERAEGNVEVTIEKLEGESDSDALARHIDEMAARLRGAPIPSKK
jgi:hypothetical protein